MPEKWEYRPGTLIPGTKYQVVAKLGEGGMGTVYEVEDVSVERRFVLKTIHVKYAGHQVAVDRFVREAKALGKLEHKNIVQVVTAGVTGDGLQLRYFVMEKLSGYSLREVLDSKGALPFDAACRFMIDLMSALNCAHDAGIVHRDIKPENIFISRDVDGLTTLKLLDFGIMTSTGTRTSDRRGFMGTARYAAPEMMSEGYEATPQSDLYSASLVFYELVCGTGPFDDAEEIPQLMEAHRTKPPPAPSAFRPDIPASLEALILRGLAKNPVDRQVDAFAYAEATSVVLKELRGGAPSSGGRVAATPQSQKLIAPKQTMPMHTAPLPSAPQVAPPMLASPQTPTPYVPPSLSMTDVDQRAAESFARAASSQQRSKKDEPGTMGATHSTMPGLPTQKNRAWILVVGAALLVGAVIATRSMWSSKEPAKAAASSTAAPTPKLAASTVASVDPQPKSAPTVAAAPAASSSTSAASPTTSATAAPKASTPPSVKTTSPRPTRPAAPPHPSLPGSGL